MMITAIILAAGYGKRMGTNIPKQYLQIDNKPILYYTLKAFENSDVDDILLVTGKEDILYVKEEIVIKHRFKKVSNIIAGGAERYESVYCGLLSLTGCDYVLIHDGARPCIETEHINQIVSQVQKCQACVSGVRTKDTIKIVSDDHKVLTTPKRSTLWSVQTPQAFSYSLIRSAYDKMMAERITEVTDDSMVVELLSDTKVIMIEGSYSNIKITTVEDMDIAKSFLCKRKG